MVTPASHPIGVGWPINHVKNKKYGNFVFISSLTGQCAAQKIKNFCSSSLWTCLHHMVILRSQNKITDVMTLAWVWAFNYPFISIYINRESIVNRALGHFCAHAG